MTEANGPADADNRAEATGAEQNTNGSGTWVEGLQDADNRNLVEKKQWKSSDDALKSYRDLESTFAKSLRVPGENATEDDWNAFYGKIGRPEKPDGYEFKLNAEKVPEDFPYDEGSAQEFRSWAHASGLNKQQAQKLHDQYVEHQAKQFQAAKEEALKRENDAHREIVSEWGTADTPKYKENLTLVGRAAHELGLKDALIEGGLIASDGAVRNASIAKALLRVGQELFQEDSAPSGQFNPGDQRSQAERLYGSTTPGPRG